VQILKAARFAHRHGIVHRDLKPHNVMVDDEDRVKVTDFGIARAGASDMTETGSIMGTAQYLSPEQAQGYAVSQTSDLYAIGVILFELLTGHVPFDADSTVSIALKHVSEAPPAPSVFDPSVPPALEAVVLWAMEKDPAQRPADADAFIHALEDARDAVLAQEAPGQRTAMFAPAAIPPDPFGPTDEALAAAAYAGAAATAPPYYAEPLHGEPRGRRRPPWWAWLLAALALAAAVAGIVLLTRPGDVTVPRVAGQDVQSAVAELRAAGLKASIARVTSGRPVDQVLAQDPAAGARAHDGSTVTLTVSRGPGDIAIPPVEGLDQKTAVAQLTDAGLVVSRVVRQTDDTVPAGEVVKTSPTAGQTVQRGSAVTLFVSSGPKQVTVPNVVNLTKQQAQQTLGSRGFDVTVVEQASSAADPGTVLRQNPAAGTKAEPGASVTLVVARAVPTVFVPDLTGQSASEAQDTLAAAGLVARTTFRDVTDQTQDGIVLDQRPAGGTQVKQGAPVRLFVGRFQSTTTPTTPSPGGRP